MKKLLLTLFLNICIFNLFCQTVSDNESQSKGKDVQIAIGETFAVNVLFNLADKYMLGKDYADVDFSSFKDNLTAKWWWDIDDYATNQIGHPYQGSLYFNAGRSCEVLQDNVKAAEYYQMALDMNKLTEDLQDEEITTRLHSLFE